MEGEVGAQVAPPIFFHHHQVLPVALRDAPLLAKKRDFPWKSSVFQHNRLPENQEHTMSASVANPASNWNPKMWNWDSVQFTPTPASDAADVICLGSQSSSAAAAAIVDQTKGDESSMLGRSIEEDDERLVLKLGGGGCLAEEPATRPTKRVRSGSPGSSNYPMCQVDDCRTDLSSAKDYHRRHKVCEVHSKTAKALVGNQMQRFCQQCSRFHPLSEFDEGKRSCRRRLAGHNQRRRKTQPEVASPKLQPKNQEISASGHLDVVNLLSMFARLEGNSQDKQTNIPLFERDRLVQFISNKLIASNSGNPSARSLEPGGFDLNVSQDAPLVSIEKFIKEIGDINAPSATTKLLTVLSAAIAATTAAVPATLSQRSSESSGNDKAKVQNVEPSEDANSHNKSTHMHPSVGVLPDNLISKSTVGACHQTVQQTRQSLPLQLFGPVDYDNPPELGSAIKYLSSESSNPLEERSPSSSPPVTKKLFPLHSTLEGTKYAQALECREENATVELSSINGGSAPLELFRVSEMQTENATAQRLPSRGGYKSSGSDHSPSSSHSDAQDRTGRIIFKLFGKDPSSFPDTLRAQIFNWLSHSPSDMESYIRPGCIILSIYLSMPSVAWEELEDDLLDRVVSLVQFPETDFWRNGRFLLCTNRQLVSHKDGKIHISRTWKAWSAPELTSISPVAVVGGQKTSLLLKGRNLTVPGTKIHCTYMGKYMSKEILCSTYPGTIYDDSCVERFDFPGGSAEGFGRCFVEVENGFKGNSFPVIIANVSICQELRTLEADFEDALLSDVITEEQVSNSPRYRSKEDSLHFLNELGWLFQRTQKSSSLSFSNFASSRLKYLLTFSIERDWCTLVRVLLDILVERSLNDDALKQESLELLSEVDLLSQAVKRKCRKMVDLLIQYYVIQGKDATKVYLFSPIMAGPGGITPLHMAASLQDSDDLVDALTNDPQGIGLKCWTSLLDENDHSPFMYALSRNNISYNNLVLRKLGDRTNGQVTIPVRDGRVVGGSSTQGAQTVPAISCAQCAMIGAGQLRQSPRTKGLLQRPYVHSMLAIAAVCVCVCLCFRGLPQIGSVEPFKWEKLDFGPR